MWCDGSSEPTVLAIPILAKNRLHMVITNGYVVSTCVAGRQYNRSCKATHEAERLSLLAVVLVAATLCCLDRKVTWLTVKQLLMARVLCQTARCTSTALCCLQSFADLPVSSLTL